MKKAKLGLFLLFFISTSCFISAGLYINKKNAGLEEYVQEKVVKVKSPELLSEINMNAYVSLPSSFEDIDVIENLDDIKVTEENVDDVIYEKLFSTAVQSDIVKGYGKTLVADYTIIQNGTVQKVDNNFIFGYYETSKVYNESFRNKIYKAKVGIPVHMENVYFNGYKDAVVDITVNNIFNMPYPVTNNYINNNTEYKSLDKMRRELINDASGEAKKIAREHTINNLIDTMINQSTFIKLPESLIMKELEALQLENPNSTYADAKQSLYKIFFISAVINKYEVATNVDMEKRFSKIDEEERNKMTRYESERTKFLLYEEDVINCIYKHINIDTNMSQNDEEAITTESGDYEVDLSHFDNTENTTSESNEEQEFIQGELEIATPEITATVDANSNALNDNRDNPLPNAAATTTTTNDSNSGYQLAYDDAEYTEVMTDFLDSFPEDVKQNPIDVPTIN